MSTAFIWNLPDTPRWYFAKGKTQEGDAALCRLFDQSIESSIVDATKSEILASLELERMDTQGLRLKDFFWDTSDTQAARRIRTGKLLPVQPDDVNASINTNSLVQECVCSHLHTFRGLSIHIKVPVVHS